MINYLLQIIVFQGLFLGIYEVFLKRETFFSLNRAYLLVTPFVAAIVPLLEFEILQNFVPVEGTLQIPALILAENNTLAGLSTSLEMTFWDSIVYFMETNWLLIGYFIGVVISVALFLQKYAQLKSLKNSGIHKRNGKTTIVLVPKSRVACTFFNTIFLGDELSEAEKAPILAHEMAHAQQRHSWDLLLFELLRIILWFDPFMYRNQLQLSLVHEYTADEKVVENSEKAPYLQNLLNATFGTRQVSFTNSFFNKSLIKNRIIMLQKPKSSRIAKLKFLFIVPLMLAMLTYVACAEDNEIIENDTQEMVPEGATYENYLNIKNYMKAKGVDLEMTYEEFQQAIISGTVQDEILPPPPPPPPPPGKKGQVPFAYIDESPVFPGCEGLTSSLARKECMSKKIRTFVSENFNTELTKNLGLTAGAKRILVRFMINENGDVVHAKAKASRPELEKEAVRVINSLPKMIPGKQDGKPAKVLYTLPILFQVD